MNIKPGISLQTMQEEVVKVNIEKGWYTKSVSFLEAMALLHSEVSEASEAWRMWETRDATRTMDAVAGHIPKPEGVGSEFADILIRLLDDCERFGISLEEEFWRKHEFNKTREYRHGGKNA
jgi:NTP pyrophosphatase (non-canonical NTP hydrolase)